VVSQEFFHYAAVGWEATRTETSRAASFTASPKAAVFGRVILLAGPEILIAATAIPLLSKMGAAMQRRPSTLSSLSTA